MSGDSSNNGSRDVRVFRIQSSGVVTLTNLNIVSGTIYGCGGGIYNFDFGIITINNSTLSNNQANYSGGGIRNYGIMTITSSTISDNEADDGGGIDNDGGSIYCDGCSEMLNLHNTIVANNTGGDCLNGGTIVTNAYNLIEDGSCNELDGGSPTGFVTGDPLLGLLQDNSGSTFTHALWGGSPAIDAGSCSGTTKDHALRRGWRPPPGSKSRA